MSNRSDADPVPRFNHFAFSVPPELLNETGRKEIVAFYGEVFGWTELEMLTIDRARLVLQCHRIDQFVYIVGGDPITTCASLDHFGLTVGSLAELKEVLARAKSYRERDDRVEIIDHEVEDHSVLKLHNCYFRYLFPMMVEIQYYEWPEGSQPPFASAP